MDRKELKVKIEKKIAKLESRIADLQEAAAPVAPDVAIGRVSRMDAINNKSVVEASLRNMENKLSGLKYALQNIKSPDFGICAKCNKPIPEGRILLMPEKRFCTQCSQ